DADQSAVVVGDEQAVNVQADHFGNDFADGRIRPHRKDSGSHDVIDGRPIHAFNLKTFGNLASSTLDLLIEVVSGRRGDFASLFAVVDEKIGTADDADRPTAVVDDRSGGEVLVGKQHQGFLHIGGGGDRNGIRRH